MEKNKKEKREFPRISTRLPIRLSADLFGETIDLNQTGLRFVSSKRLASSWSPAVIEVSPGETIETQFRVVWSNQLVQDRKFVYGVCFVKLMEKDLKILQRLLIEKRTLDLLESVQEIEKRPRVEEFWQVHFTRYLNTVSSLSHRMDNGLISEEEAYPRVFDINEEILMQGDKLESFLNDKFIMKKIKRIFRELSGPWVYRASIVKYAYKKPRGYPGDYKLLEMIYDKMTSSRNIGYCYDRYLLENPYAVAVRNRKEKMKDILIEIFKKKTTDRLSVLNLASGSVRELREIFLQEDFKPSFGMMVSLVDQDNEALEFSRMALMGTDSRINFRFFNHNVLDYVREGHKYAELLGRQDVIYSIGLADYLPDRILKDLLAFGFHLLNPGGLLIIAHKDSKQYKPLAPDWWCDWTFYHRSEKDVVEIFKRCGISRVSVMREPSGIMFFIIAEAK